MTKHADTAHPYGGIMFDFGLIVKVEIEKWKLTSPEYAKAIAEKQQAAFNQLRNNPATICYEKKGAA